MSAKTNKRIGSKSPSVYLKQFEKEGIAPTRLDEMLYSHAINPMMLRRDDFEGFFTTRTKALMEIISKAMAKCLTVESFGTPGEDYNNGNGNGLQQLIND